MSAQPVNSKAASSPDSSFPTTPSAPKADYHILYPFALETSQGGLFSAAQLTASGVPAAGFNTAEFHSADTKELTLGNSKVHPTATPGRSFPYDSWFRHDFLFQHLQAYTTMLPEAIATEIYRDRTINEKPGTLEYLIKFFENHPVDFSLDEKHSADFQKSLAYMKAGDTVSIQGPVWFIPFIRDNAQTMRDAGVKHVQFEHQLIPQDFEKTPLGARMLPCYSAADVIFFHTSVYADRLANMLTGELPVMKTVDLGIDRGFIDSALNKVRDYRDIPAPGALSDAQAELVRASFAARDQGAHRFMCIDRLDPMKGTHAVITGIKLFLDEARATEGEGYAKRYQFSCIHELLTIDTYAEMNPKDQYIRLCKSLYADLQRSHPGVVSLSESFTTSGGNRDLLPRMMHGATLLALLGQDGLGLTALEGAYINRDQNVGLIIGDQSGTFLEADKRGYGDLVFGAKAGDPVAIKEALQQTVALRERAGGELANRNQMFVDKFVLPRTDSMMLE